MTTRTTVQPGALTALLGDLARAPDATGWAVPAVPGETIGRFEILREIGRGGFGVVYEARDTELGRAVAFKAIRSGATDAVREQRALAEAEAAARLAHPNIVHLYDVGRCERGAFLILELLHGEPLDDRLARGPLKLRDAVHVATEIARGLAHAHEQGVVHRDLKPGNVFLCDDGQVKVLDFGLAHVFGRGGLGGGTPAYMAPEQARGGSSDERADVYALGVILHELVAGRRPFEDGVPGGGKAPDLPGAPAALSKLAGRMLAREPGDRPASGAEAREQLAAVRRSLEPRRLFWAGWTLAAAALAVAGWVSLRPTLPPGRLSVVLADTTNATREPDLDAVTALFGKALEQSRRVAVVARSSVVKILQATAGRPALDGGEASRAAARAAGAQVLLVPAVRRDGDAYAVDLRIIDVQHDRQLAVVRERADARGSLLDALDRLSDRARAALGEEPGAASGPRLRIAQVISPSAEAQRHYADAQRFESEALWQEAADAYRRALAVDADFALAHLGLSFAIRQAEEDEAAADRHLDAATRLLERVPPKERLLVEALRARREGRFTESLERYDRVIAEWPHDPAAYWWAGAMLFSELSDCAAARPYLEKAIRVGGLSEHQVMMSHLALGQLDEALDVSLRRAEATRTAVAFRDLALARRARGETAEALAAARRSLSLGGKVGLYLFWTFVEGDATGELRVSSWDPALQLLEGRRRAVLASLASAMPGADAPAFEHVGYHADLLDVLAGDGEGDPERVWHEVEMMFRFGAGGRRMTTAAHVLAWLGDLERAERLARMWRGADPRQPALRLYRFVRDWKGGDPATAARELAEGECLNNPRVTFLLGEVLQDLGRHGDAVEAFRRFRRLPDEPGGPLLVLLYPRALYLEAASLERLGRREEALAAVDRLLRMWRRADPELRTLREAKALRARLAAAGAP